MVTSSNCKTNSGPSSGGWLPIPTIFGVELAGELPHYPQNDLLLPTLQTSALAQYGASPLICQGLKHLLVEHREGGLTSVQKVGGRHCERCRKRRHLPNGGIGDRPGPDACHVPFRKDARILFRRSAKAPKFRFVSESGFRFSEMLKARFAEAHRFCKSLWVPFSMRSSLRIHC